MCYVSCFLYSLNKTETVISHHRTGNYSFHAFLFNKRTNSKRPWLTRIPIRRANIGRSASRRSAFVYKSDSEYALSAACVGARRRGAGMSGQDVGSQGGFSLPLGSHIGQHFCFPSWLGWATMCLPSWGPGRSPEVDVLRQRSGRV